MTRRSILWAGFAVLISMGPNTLAGVVTWTGSASSDWTNPANWSTGVLPGASDDVVINANPNQQVRLRITGGGTTTVHGLFLGQPLLVDTVNVLNVSTGILNNSTLTINDLATLNGSVSGGQVQFIKGGSNGGTIANGTVASPVTVATGIYDQATLTGATTVLPAGVLRLRHDLALAGGSINLTVGANGSDLIFDSPAPQNITGFGEIVMGGAGSRIWGGADRSTLGSGITVRGSGEFGFGLQTYITNRGTIRAEGGVLYLEMRKLLNTGVIEAAPGATIRYPVDGSSYLFENIDPVTKTLSGGTYVANHGGIDMGSRMALINAADVTVRGADAGFSPIGSMVTNAGGFHLAEGYQFDTAGPLQNLGAITLNDPGTSLGFGGALTGSGSLSIKDGSVRLTRNPSPTNNAVSNLSIQGQGRLDVANDALTLKFTDVSTVRNYLTTGFNHGNWDGPGLNSFTAANDPTHRTALGYAAGADGIVVGLAADSVLVRYTLAGDCNLDGNVDLSDYTAVVRNFGKSGAAWDQGDFNYDGTVGLDDYSAVVRNFGLSVDSMSPSIAAVPEPVAAGILALGAMRALCRRR